MSTPKKSTVLLSAVASTLLLAACASHQPAPHAEHPPMVVASVNPLSAADIYAQRYPSSFAQVSAGGKYRFVSCDPSCPGATPKTPMSSVNAAVAKRARQNLLAERLRVSTTTSTDGDGSTGNNDSGER